LKRRGGCALGGGPSRKARYRREANVERSMSRDAVKEREKDPKPEYARKMGGSVVTRSGASSSKDLTMVGFGGMTAGSISLRFLCTSNLKGNRVKKTTPASWKSTIRLYFSGKVTLLDRRIRLVHKNEKKSAVKKLAKRVGLKFFEGTSRTGTGENWRLNGGCGRRKITFCVELI